ncbi:hypothetical protein NQ315_002255 [Exocentrus adspersus]|uniref:DJ-1/PfpI domain-containing protein n=1 Tax=Exocentrus adspersus TaxID=1586481 RepID=A0AAV8VS57_9CUCU|nr:hypothetical protein NQ315_002255 [Exocentrus adspersus]
MSRRALVLLAPGSEEMEVVICVDLLRRGGIEVSLAGLCDASDLVTCSKGVTIKPDIHLSEARGQFDVVVLPGGVGGTQSLARSKEVGRLLKQQEQEGRYIATLCTGPTVLKAHQIGLGKRITSHPSAKEKLHDVYDYKEDNVVIDGNVISCRGPGTAFEFALTLIEALISKDKAMDVAKAMDICTT